MSKNTEAALIDAAIAARSHAYAPYSRYAVGAAVLDDKGNVHRGCNVENAAYPQGTCAEAGAISAMVAAGARKIEAIAIAGPGPDLCTPCGGCRQKIREFATPGTLVLICDRNGLQRRFELADLLPESFGPNNLLREP